MVRGMPGSLEPRNEQSRQAGEIPPCGSRCRASPVVAASATDRSSERAARAPAVHGARVVQLRSKINRYTLVPDAGGRNPRERS